MPVTSTRKKENTPQSGVGIDAANLYKLCLNRDEKAWRLLFSWCRKKASFKLPGEEAEDVAQVVCLNLLKGNIEKIEEPKAFLGYVGRMVFNETQNIHRFRKTRAETSLEKPVFGDEGQGVGLGQMIPAPGSLPESQVAARQLLARLMEQINRLPEYCRGIMPQFIRYKMGLVKDHKEIAGILGRPHKTVSVQIKRCLDRLGSLPEFIGLLEKRSSQ